MTLYEKQENCPWCGGESCVLDYGTRYRVECRRECLYGLSGGTPEIAVTYWNDLVLRGMKREIDEIITIDLGPDGAIQQIRGPEGTFTIRVVGKTSGE